jgi:hypothetical protein
VRRPEQAAQHPILYLRWINACPSSTSATVNPPPLCTCCTGRLPRATRAMAGVDAAAMCEAQSTSVQSLASMEHPGMTGELAADKRRDAGGR